MPSEETVRLILELIGVFYAVLTIAGAVLPAHWRITEALRRIGADLHKAKGRRTSGDSSPPSSEAP